MQQPVGKRIIVIGSSNAGKSTLASRLATMMVVPFIELDALHWEPGWVEADDDVFRDRIRIRLATEPDSWVVEGNYIQQQQHVSWPLADTIVWLDLSLPIVLCRCVRRSWQRWRTQEVLYGGSNRENFWEHLMLWDTDKSLIAFIAKTHRHRRRDFAAISIDPRWSHLTFIRLRSVAEIDRWLNRVRDQREPTTGHALEVATSSAASGNPGTSK